MNQDKTGFYDVYGPLVLPWWKTQTFQVMVFAACLILLITICFLLYKWFGKKKHITDFEQLILHRNLLDKTEDSAVILYDYAVRVLKELISDMPQKSSLTAKEFVIFIKNCQNKNLFGELGDRLVLIVERAESVRFGKENLAWDIVHHDIDYVIMIAKKIQSRSKK